MNVTIACAIIVPLLVLACIGLVWVFIIKPFLPKPLPPIQWTTQTVNGTSPPCGTWQIMIGTQPSDPGSRYNIRLHAVAAVADDDVWAVGEKGGGIYMGGNVSALVLHWDGSRWSEVSIPNPGGWTWRYLNGVAAISRNEVWVAGYYAVNDGQRPMTLRWNGQGWSDIPTPFVGGTKNEITSLSATSRNDMWTVGSFLVSPSGPSVPLMHWDGRLWSLVTNITNTTAYGSDGVYKDVAALSNKEAWAVGVAADGVAFEGSAEQGVALRWDGARWSEVPVPRDPRLGRLGLNGVAMVSADDVWAVGYGHEGRSSYKHTIILHWNGVDWTYVPVPSSGAEDDSLLSVAAVRANDVWAVGGAGGAPAPNETLVEHWDGRQWSLVPEARVVDAGFSDVITLPNGNVWAVGNHFDSANARNEALIAHFVPGSCPSP